MEPPIKGEALVGGAVESPRLVRLGPVRVDRVRGRLPVLRPRGEYLADGARLDQGLRLDDLGDILRVLGHEENTVRHQLLGRRDDPLGGVDADGDGLLEHDVAPRPHRHERHLLVERADGRDHQVAGLEQLRLRVRRDGRRERVELSGGVAHRREHLVGHLLPVRGERVDHGCHLEAALLPLGRRGDGGKVVAADNAAADQREPDPARHGERAAQQLRVT